MFTGDCPTQTMLSPTFCVNMFQTSCVEMSQTHEHTTSVFRSIEKPIRRDSGCCHCHLPAAGATKLLSQYDPNDTGFNCTATESCPVESEVGGQSDFTGQYA